MFTVLYRRPAEKLKRNVRASPGTGAPGTASAR
jgi:hypothetical protein